MCFVADEELICRKIKIFWSKEKCIRAEPDATEKAKIKAGKWFEGRIDDFDKDALNHVIQYSENPTDWEALNLLELDEDFPAWELSPYQCGGGNSWANGEHPATKTVVHAF